MLPSTIEVLTTVILLVGVVLFVCSTVPFLGWNVRPYELLISLYLAGEFLLKAALFPAYFDQRVTIIVDLLSFAPSVVELALFPLGQSLHMSQTFSILRLFRIVRVSRLVVEFHPTTVLVLECMWLAVWDSLSTLISLLTLMSIGLLMGSTLIYFAESYGWNGRPSPLNSVPMAAWSVVQMISTVGLGDVAPITPLGRLIGGVLMMTAMCLVAFPSIILALNFQRHYDLQRQRPLDETDLL